MDALMRMSSKIRALGLSLMTVVMFASTVLIAEEQYAPVQLSRDIPTVSLGGTVVPFKEVTLAAQLPGRVNFIAGIEGKLVLWNRQFVYSFWKQLYK